MTHFLREAFARACALPGKLRDAYDYAGFTLYRAMNDDSFLALDRPDACNAAVKNGMDVYNGARDFAQAALCNVMNKSARGEIALRPTMKVAARAFNIGAALALRANWTNPAALAVTGLAVAAAGYIYLHGGGHIVADTIAGLYATAQRAKPRP